MATESNKCAFRGGQSCAEMCQRARSLWLDDDEGISGCLDPVEELYAAVWSRRSATASAAGKKRARNDEGDACYCFCCPDPRQQAGEKLALIYLQSDRAEQADEILQKLKYVCRLSRSILNYTNTTTSLQDVVAPSSDYDNNIPCRIYDNFLTHSERQLLETVFLDPSNSYWADHNYTVEPPSPYFSYLLPLQSSSSPSDGGGMGQLVRHLRDFLVTNCGNSLCPNLDKAEYVELWAHNRPHATGHQFHFDSDNEGCGSNVIRNPICSCVLYLTDNCCGGPSIVTNQRLASRHLATKGWMCPAAANRLLVFDGKVLHGVVPGKAADDDVTTTATTSTSVRRRVTVMLAFWRRIRVREGPGAAQLLPQPSKDDDNANKWVHQLQAPLKEDTNVVQKPPVLKQPIALSAVYESVANGTLWTRSMGMPDYEQLFQGF